MPVPEFNHNLIKISKRQYRNPIHLAKEWREALDKGRYASPAALALNLKVSRARVTQILNLLKLSPEVIQMISSFGDPLRSPFVTERRLRPLLSLNLEQQKVRVEIMLSKNTHE
jgi:ParB-like chromosome segregation protein Spo0J